MSKVSRLPTLGTEASKAVTRRLLTEDRRLALLKLLTACPGNIVNCNVLRAGALLHGHSISTDRLRVDVAWLEEMELVSVQETDLAVLVTLTERGSEVAAGVVRVPGVGLAEP